MKVYEFLIIYQPNEKSKKNGDKAKILVERQTILAASEKEAIFKASKAVPEDYCDKFEELEVAVRPF